MGREFNATYAKDRDTTYTCDMPGCTTVEHARWTSFHPKGWFEIKRHDGKCGGLEYWICPSKDHKVPSP